MPKVKELPWVVSIVAIRLTEVNKILEYFAIDSHNPNEFQMSRYIYLKKQR